ncbi:DNA polymerase III subunit delta' [Prochlorococcus sp. MIT 1307]|uniref:DNA polymerase III subunit delta' n=1 Tax=Prochlorococcus sp. MIT 1307 TaxID=3096219 RepID=UPI002A74C972|nr:DNA polymerase III subunit delta' [Prochlorococcus sp. MIT 1307]
MVKELSQQLFDDVINQNTAVSLLSVALKKNQIAPAYLFSGPSGVGRSLTARRFLEGLITGGIPEIRERRRVEALNHPDLIWIEPTYLHQGKLIPQSNASNETISRRNPPQIRLEQIKAIKAFLSKKPLEADLGMVVIDAFEMMNESASNALLKTLEEPRNGTLILITEKPESILDTIRSRCQIIPFNRLNKEAIEKVLSKIKSMKMPDIEYALQQKELINLSNGSPGALIKNIEIWQEFPQELWDSLKTLPQQPIEALSLARDITDQLDIQQQLWLINWLQYYLWRQNNDAIPIRKLEILRSQLNSFVQPRLAWEVTLLRIIQAIT